jgi:Transglycosylase SLT domain/N-acetylmuramoyl-L-alanine amidase
MGGDAGSMLGNVAGRVLGVLSALPSRGGGFSNLANYMAARQRAMSDPNARAALTPFGAGFYQIGGGMRPELAPTPEVAAPAEFMGPTIPTAAGPAAVAALPRTRWMPSLPPLAPEAALKEEAQRRTIAGLQSPDVITRARAKQDAGIPLAPEETDALIAAGAEIRRTAGPDSSVTIGPGGTTVTLGQPGMPPGVVQTPPAGEMPREQLPLLPGQVPQFTGRYNANGQPLYQAVTPPKVEPTGVAPLPTAPARPAAPPPAAAPPPPPAAAAPPPPPPPAAPPVVAAPPPAPAAPPPAAAPPAAAPPSPPPTLPPHEVVRRLPDGTFVPVTPPPPAGAPVAYPSPAFGAAPPTAEAPPPPPPPEAATTVTPTTGGPPAALPVYPARGFVFHHSGGSTLEGLRNTLEKRGLGSQYLMDRDGTIYSFAGTGSPHIRPNDQFGGIAPGLSNKNAVGMELVAKNDQDITPAQVASARSFIAANYPDVPVYGHGQVNPGHKMADEGLTVVNAIHADRGVQPGTAVPRRAPNTVDLNAPFFRQVDVSRGLPVGTMAGLAEKESGGNPQAANPASSARGLFQITRDTARSWGISADDRYDPVKATLATADTLAARARDVGLERAIGMHYGGPGADFTKPIDGQSPAQYARDVLRRSAKYAPAPPSEAAVVAAPSPAFGAPAPPLLGRAAVAPTGYDLASAQAAGMTPSRVPGPNYLHMGSRSPYFISPAGIPEGLLLKGEQHPTERLGLEGERAYGNVVVQRDGRLVSVPPWEVLPTEQPIDLVPRMLGGMPAPAAVAGPRDLWAPAPGEVGFAPPAPAVPGAAPGLPAPARIAPPAALPWVSAPAGAPGPRPAVPVAPPPAAAVPVAPPPGVPAGAEKFTQTQPIKPEAGGGTITFAGEVPGAPQEPTAPKGGFNETIFLRENGIDPTKKPPPGTTEALNQYRLDYERRLAEAKADVERRYGKPGEAVSDSLVRLRLFRSFVNTLLTEFSPEERARYTGMLGLTPYLKGGPLSQDPRFIRFRSLNAALRTSVFAEAGKAVTAPELALLAPTLPSGYEATDVGYEGALQLTTDKLDRLITGYGAQANMRVEDLTPEKQRALVEQYLSAPDAPRYGPYDWVRGGGVAPPEQRQMVTQPGQVIQGGPAAPPPSPFVVDRLYTLPPPAR